MELLTQEIKERLPKIGATENVSTDEKEVVAKFFTPWGYWTWYVVEGEEQGDGDWLFFGRVHGDYTEWGYFSLSSLLSVQGPFGLKIERDIHFSGKIPKTQ